MGPRAEEQQRHIGATFQTPEVLLVTPQHLLCLRWAPLHLLEPLSLSGFPAVFLWVLCLSKDGAQFPGREGCDAGEMPMFPACLPFALGASLSCRSAAGLFCLPPCPSHGQAPISCVLLCLSGASSPANPWTIRFIFALAQGTEDWAAGGLLWTLSLLAVIS